MLTDKKSTETVKPVPQSKSSSAISPQLDLSEKNPKTSTFMTAKEVEEHKKDIEGLPWYYR